MTKPKGRRELKVRQASLTISMAHWLSQQSISPNQISITSIFFAALAGLCLVYIPYSSSIPIWLLAILAAIFIQFRLLCNLFDGMIAVEGGKSTVSGELFNDIPDRIADPLILVSAGFAISALPWGENLGWLAGLLAVMTAYIRYLGISMGAPGNFMGPMAKQHRMALMTTACVIFALVSYFSPENAVYVFQVALIIIILGCIVTLLRRSTAIYHYLENNQNK